MEPPILSPGEVVAERFEVGPLVGAGVFATVHRAVDRDTGEAVALKLLRPDAAASDELVERFGRTRESMAVVARMWPRMNLAAPDLRELLVDLGATLVERAETEADAWREWIGGTPDRLRAAVEVFRRVSTGEV